jgi:hypothetical protein
VQYYNNYLKKTKKMNQTEEILTISGKEFKIILFSKEKVDFAVVPKFGDEEIREMVLDEWERKENGEWELEIPIILEQHLKFEVYPKELGEHNWKNAKKVCEDLGDRWRLPTREELHVMWLHRDYIGGFAAAYYWSSSEYNPDYAWNQYFGNGNQDYNFKAIAYYVRAVRALSI